MSIEKEETEREWRAQLPVSQVLPSNCSTPGDTCFLQWPGQLVAILLIGLPVLDQLAPKFPVLLETLPSQALAACSEGVGGQLGLG